MAARLLGPAARGELAAIQMLPQLLLGLAIFGLPSAITFHTASAPDRAGDLLGTALAVSIAATLLSLMVGASALPFLLADYRPGLALAARSYLLLMLPLLVVWSLLSSTLLGLKDYAGYNLQRLPPAAIYCAAIAWAFVRPDAILVAQLHMAGTLLVVLPSILWACRRSVRRPLGVSRASAARLLPYALVSLLTTLPFLAGQRLDQFFVLARLDAAALGIYSIAIGIGQVLQTLQSASGTILLPYLAGASGAGVDPTRLFGRLLRLSVVYSLLLLLLLLAVLPVLLPLMFGRDFAAALVPAGLLLAAAAITGLNVTLSDGFRGLGRPRLALWSETLSIAVKATLLVGFFRHLTLPLAAGLALVGPLAALALNASFYHSLVEPLDRRWLSAFGPELRDTAHRLRSRALAMLRR